MNKHLHLLCIGIFLLAFNTLQAQTINISGTVSNADDGFSLPGASVSIKATSVGTITDFDGKYSLKANMGDILVFSFLGMSSREVVVGNQKEINIQLSPDLKELDQVVIVGYGTVKKSDMTGAVASVKAEELNLTPTTNVAEMLRGKVAGLQVNLESGRPGGTSNILIRGRNSFGDNSSPLLVLDGVPVDNINDVNSNDIESIEVLKDASSQAIYGARASNGVILVTTKRGSSGKISVSYDAYVGVQTLWKNFDVMNADEWIKFLRESYRADANSRMLDTALNWQEFLPNDLIMDEVMLDVYKNGTPVDWEKLVTNNAFMQKHDISLRGGNEKTQLAASIGYFYQDGLRPSSDYERYSLRLNLDQKINKYLSFGMNTFLLHSSQEREASTSYFDYLTLPPLAKPYDENGDLQLYVTNDDRHRNPLYNNQESERMVYKNKAIVNAFLRLDLNKYLNYKLNLSVTGEFSEDNSYLSTKHEKGQTYVLVNPDNPSGAPIGNGGQSEIQNRNNADILLENIINYNRSFASVHNLDLTLMQSMNKRSSRSLTTSSQNYVFDILGSNGIGDGMILLSPENRGYNRQMLSYMGRVRYKLLDKYLLTLSTRIDGSSVFGSKNKYGVFPALAFAWKLHEEDFFKNATYINRLKMRFSIGTIGNEAINPYTTLGLTRSVPYTTDNGVVQVGYLADAKKFPNADLKWETTLTKNLGIDFGLLEDRISGTFDAYIKNTYELLVDTKVPTATGYSEMITNLGEVKNSGFEAAINGYIIKKSNFDWSVNLTWSMNKNKIIKIDEQTDRDGNPINDLTNTRFIGEPIDVYYDYDFDGIWQTGEDNALMPTMRPGDVKLKDINGDSTITAEGDRMLYYKDPQWIATVGTSLKYKMFDLGVSFYIRQGGVKSNSFLYDGEYGAYKAVFNTIQKEYWTPENPSNTNPRPYFDASSSSYKSTLGYQDASYIQLRSIVLGCNIPAHLIHKFKIEKLRIYASGTNLWTKTDYLSYNPEVSPTSYPQGRTYTLGLNITF